MQKKKDCLRRVRDSQLKAQTVWCEQKEKNQLRNVNQQSDFNWTEL